MTNAQTLRLPDGTTLRTSTNRRYVVVVAYGETGKAHVHYRTNTLATAAKKAAASSSQLVVRFAHVIDTATGELVT